MIKRRIPRVAVATLTFGGTAGAAVAGCGGSNSVEAYCEHVAGCYGYGSAYVNSCVEEFEYYMSYYSSSCQRAIRRALRCITSTTCDDLYSSYAFIACADEMDAVYANCDFDEYYYD
jgi:hypothetical protein